MRKVLVATSAAAILLAGGTAVLAARPANSRMSEAAFWALIADTRRAADNDTAEQSSLLEERLSKLPPSAILDFARIRKQFDRRVYTWRIWGAAYVIEDKCTRECFRDFRGYVISLGRGPYERALVNPDSLASSVEDPEKGDWENADNVAPDAYSSATGGHFPGDASDLTGPPRGRRFPHNDRSALARQYPGLAARFR
jgi:murein DD-endopeptidase MepM/ murein hydrolase activator NlpD